MRLRPYRPIALVLLALHMQACATWQPSTVAPRQLIEDQRPQSVRVIRSDGTSEVVRNPRIEKDSIAVVSGECRRSPNRGRGYICPTTQVVALEDVRTIEVRAAARRPTSGLFIFAISVAMLGLMVDSAWSGIGRGK